MDTSDCGLSEQDAEMIARKHLEHLNLSDQLTDRVAEVTRKRSRFVVVFNPPAGIRGGAFTVAVGKDGEILDQKFER